MSLTLKLYFFVCFLGAKIRQDPSGGYVVATTGWGDSVNDQVVVVAKLGSTLELEWIQGYGVNGGSRQVHTHWGSEVCTAY